MSSVSTHVLDTSRGKPAAGVRAMLEIQASAGWVLLGEGETNGDGRITAFVAGDVNLKPGVYRLRFEIETYQTGFYPEVTITFRIDNPSQHYHVPLLLSPYGYSTYRGS